MENEFKNVPSFNDIVFETRNKEYGAYVLRANYSRNVILALMAGVIIMASATIVPYLKFRAVDSRLTQEERLVEIRLENLDQPVEQFTPPPEPPAAQEILQQAKYIPPLVVDSVRPEDEIQLMTADQAQIEVQDSEVIEEIVQLAEEIEEVEEEEAEPFYVVEEMPMFPGGDAAIQAYIGANVVYPEVAKENNIQGRVIVKFCVTPTGVVDQVSILKGVDQELDAEVIRVVKTLPKFKPGKQGGKPVPVWHTIPIFFKLQ
ncbi:MAG: energy transducer TonB [Bacteroidales bacterium]|nr:energy transducer TonB [Bacteroidales bacterium]